MEEKYTSERRNDNIDIVALWRAACRKWYLFVGSIVVCVALVVCYLKIAKPVYEVSIFLSMKMRKKAVADCLH